MPVELTANEARVLGCLMEKSVLTPDVYPLTLNALTQACNQKSSREPVMSLEPGAVQATVRALEQKRLVRVEENFRTRVEKYTQRFCNTPFSDYQFDPAEFAIVCVLLLRGPRTPGELRANSGRLHTFADNGEVVGALERLMHRDGEPLVAELPRTPGRRDNEYVHLFSGAPPARANRDRPVHVERATDRAVAAHVGPMGEQKGADLERRVAALEAEVRALRALLEARD